jgi:hypothetical protein
MTDVPKLEPVTDGVGSSLRGGMIDVVSDADIALVSLLECAPRRNRAYLRALLKETERVRDAEARDGFRKLQIEHGAKRLIGTSEAIKIRWRAPFDIAIRANERLIQACLKSGVRNREVITEFVQFSFRTAMTPYLKIVGSTADLDRFHAKSAQEVADSIAGQVTIAAGDFEQVQPSWDERVKKWLFRKRAIAAVVLIGTGIAWLWELKEPIALLKSLVGTP